VPRVRGSFPRVFLSTMIVAMVQEIRVDDGKGKRKFVSGPKSRCGCWPFRCSGDSLARDRRNRPDPLSELHHRS
jgi:hypothetical protein